MGPRVCVTRMGGNACGSGWSNGFVTFSRTNTLPPGGAMQNGRRRCEMFEFEEANENRALIRIVGIGGAGSNAVNTMISAGLTGVDFIAANTDAQALRVNLAQIKLQLGGALTKGLGAGADPEVGKRATIESEDELRGYLADSDMVFVTAGM